MKPFDALVFILVLWVSSVKASHYRGGSVSWSIRSLPQNITSNLNELPVRITQRHSWRRSYGKSHFCDNNTVSSSGLIGEGELVSSLTKGKNIKAMVECTDFNEQFDYSSGEISTAITLPQNKIIEYFYQGCCWIELLPPDTDQSLDWSLKLVINTNRRRDGQLNNSPKSAMNPIVQVQIGKIHVIQIPMADSDGDSVRCRWGRKQDKECGSICSPKGPLTSNPCVLTYNATQLGYAAVALVIEDFDSNNEVLSSIPLQFLIHIVNVTVIANGSQICNASPIYVGDRPQGACIGVKSNSSITERVRFRIPCMNTSTTLTNILTISPPGMTKGSIIRDSFDPNLYSMEVQWTPRSDQYGIYQLCLTPVDSQQRTGSQICLTFQVDIYPPQFIGFHPTGIVPNNQAIWTIEVDRDIVSPRRSNDVNIRFFKRSNKEEVWRVNVTSTSLARYEPRKITFDTSGNTWDEGEEYYILLDSGVATVNESCGIESAPVTDTNIWTFQILERTTVSSTVSTNRSYATTTTEMTTTTAQIRSSNATTNVRTTATSAGIPRPACPQWFSFNTLLNESTNAEYPTFIFCFTVDTMIADVTIAVNTWVPCSKWKNSGASDPLIELYSESDSQLLAENDDGNSIPSMNCYASVLSYRLPKDNYRVIIRNPKCAHGFFELRFLANGATEQK